MESKQIIKFDAEEIKAFKKVYPNLSKEEAILNWAHRNGYSNCDLEVKGNKLTITERF